MKHVQRVIVIGGGPAGIMAAIKAAETGLECVLIEKNERLGKKFLLTGGGRCNITNTAGLDDFIAAFLSGGDFLRDAFKAFFNTDLIRFFENNGAEISMEGDGRVVSSSGRAIDLLRVLEEEIIRKKVAVRLKSAVERVSEEDGRVRSVRLKSGEDMGCGAVVLAVGGASYPSTGSSGDGYRIAEKLGHKIISPRAGLVPLISDDRRFDRLSGISLKDVKVTLRSGDKKKFVSDAGDVLFTGQGISGPLILSMSGRVSDILADGERVSISIDLKPDLAAPDTEKWVDDQISKGPKKTAVNLLKNFYPERFIALLLEVSGIDGGKPAGTLSRRDRLALGAIVKSMPVKIKGTAPLEEGMITRGGVSLKEVNPRTMESRKVGGLFFAGEILDIDAVTGGFNLQAAFSTGYLAGKSARESLK